MFCCYIVLVLAIVHVRSECVRYAFEDDYQSSFSNETGPCTSLLFWEKLEYGSFIDSPNELSTSYISPMASLSCVSSFEFSMGAGGVLEFLVYMYSESSVDEITIIVYNTVANGMDVVVDSIRYGHLYPDFVSGWQTLNISLDGLDTFEGYVSFMGVAAEESIVLIDSFRYIPPNGNDDNCKIYDASTPDSTTSEFTTQKPTTINYATEEPTTLEITTMENSTPELTTEAYYTTQEPTKTETNTQDATTVVNYTEPSPNPDLTATPTATHTIPTEDTTTPDYTTSSTINLTTLIPTTEDLTTLKPTTQEPSTQEITTPESTTSEYDMEESTTQNPITVPPTEEAKNVYIINNIMKCDSVCVFINFPTQTQQI